MDRHQKGLCQIHINSQKTKWYTISQGGLPHNYIHAIFLDSKNRLWVSSLNNTLAYIQDEKVFKFPLSSKSGIFTLGPITEDSDSTIWVGSNGNGVFSIKFDSIANFTITEGLLSNFCYSLISDDRKNIWVGHKGGLSKIRLTDFSVKQIQQFNGIAESYLFNPNASFKDQQGKIWFGSNKGFVSYDPSMESPHLLAPVLEITSLKIDDEEKKLTNKIILAPGNHKIRIDFLGISLKDPTLVTYQFKLEGYGQWSEVTKNTSITYNHLTEGNYTFYLKASSGDGIVTQKPLTIKIIIKKPFWKQSWFFPVALLLLIVLTFIYIKRREYSFLAEKLILEDKVQERTNEIENQKYKIELQRDLIDEKNASITSSIKYASYIQNAVLPPMELIDEILPNNFIYSKPKDIVSGDFYWLTEKDKKIVFTVADCTGHGVPGAFMSLLGITLLNEIVNVQGITKSDAIVESLRERLIHSLQHGNKANSSLNGIDIALCVLDKQLKTIQFTGGIRNLIYIRDGKLKIVDADRYSVCGSSEDLVPFTKKEINYRKGDIFYLFTDGYVDQFGGPNDKKFLIHRFYELLIEIHELPMVSQKTILENKILEWMNNTVQTDDITVMGVRL